MNKRKGFTLIELLVVIAVIALLMAILMPALTRVKRHAKAIACRAILKQWALIFSMYTDDNNGYFMRSMGWTSESTLKPYFVDSPDILACPMAVKHINEGGKPPFCIWSTSSYGINSWVPNPLEDTYGNRPVAWCWRTPHVSHGDRIPMFLDCDRWQNTTPFDYDAPPEFDGQGHATDGNEDEMRSVCINRHDGWINGAFVDFSVRKIGLKELWTLKWHKTFDTAGEWTKAGGATQSKWANYGTGWLAKYKEY